MDDPLWTTPYGQPKKNCIAKGALALFSLLEFGESEKRTEGEVDNTLLSPPLDLTTAL